MGTTAIRAGVHVAIEGADHKLLRKVDNEIWQVENSRTFRIAEFRTATLRQLYEQGRLVFASSDYSIAARGEGRKISDISELQWARAKVKRAYVIAVLHLPSTQHVIRPTVSEVWERLGTKDRCPHPKTVLEWKRRYVDSGNDLTSLVDQTHRKGNRLSRYPQETVDLVNDVIDEIYMTLERKSLQDVLDESIDRVKKENALRPRQIHIRRPTFRQVRSLVKEIPAFDRVAARYGRTVAMNRFRSVQCYLVADVPLERAEIDHTRLDLIVIDDDTFMPLGRPWLTVCLDVRTRCVLGIYLGFEPPSHLSVAACLRHAFLPKTKLRDEFPSIENEWTAHGVMHELVVDNGVEFHSESLENACLSLGTEIHYSARKTPWHKGKVERFLKTLNDSVSHGSPGTTFSNILEKGDYDPSKHAIVRLSKIQEIVRKWIVDVYHQRPHRAIGVPPELDWMSSIGDEDILLPDDPAIFDAILGRTETRKLTHKGTELDGLLYNSPELSDLRKRYGEKLTVELRIDDSNIGEIIVVCPKTGDLYRVSALHSDYAAGLSRWQHQVCKSYSRREFDKNNWESWLNAKHEISRMVQEEFLTKGKGTRSRAARFKNAGKDTMPADQCGGSTEATPTTSQPGAAAAESSPDVSVPETPMSIPDTRNDFEIDYQPIAPVYRDRTRPSEETCK
tara:strand:- start:2574 stop:4604 length:2031 start_codon:yes stop_codon:yes gene_type:complete